MTAASPGVRALTMSSLSKELETKRKAFLELRELLFGNAGEPDQTNAEWEREAWRIITRALEAKPCM